MSVSASVTSNAGCSGIGSSNATISNGSGGIYTYSWSNGSSGTTTASIIPVSGLTAGTYSINITDGSCISTSTVTISQALNINSIASTNLSCNAANNGSVTVTVNGGTGPYTYSWSNGIVSITNTPTNQLTNLSAGTYSVTVNQGSCLSVTGATITEPSAMSVLVSKQLPCSANSGTITLTPSNGTPPYSFLWNGGQTTSTIVGLAVGNYTVTVRDQSSCTTSRIINILDPIPLIVVNSSVTNITCAAAGSLYMNTNGVFPLTYTWSDGQKGYNSYPSGSYGYTNVSFPVAGVYTVTITDGNGCSATKSFNITGTNPVAVSFSNPPPCIGQQVCFTNTGSTGTYSWNIGAPVNVSGTTADFCYTFLNAGTYNVSQTITSGGCTNTLSKSITVINCSAGPTVIATGSSVCPNKCASVTSSGSGGYAPYTYNWSNGATTQNINPCPASTTTYTVTITDTGGNSSTSTAVVTVHPAISATTTATNITCSGTSTGSATATGGSGSSPYTYSWSNGGTTSQISNLTSQIYTVTVTDSKGCTSVSTASIISPAPIVGQFTKGTASCLGCGCKEWILVTATGGTSPYSYSWPDGYDKRYKNQLCPGIYSVYIKDKNGCSINVNLTAP